VHVCLLSAMDVSWNQFTTQG